LCSGLDGPRFLDEGRKKVKSNRESKSRGLRSLVALVLVLTTLLGMVTSLSADPPVPKPPEITKATSRTHMRIPESVRFTVTVRNPGAPDNEATWRSVRVWDEIDPAFRIEKVSVTPNADDVSITGNIVWVKFNRLEPGESFVVTIDCTLVGPVEPGEVLENMATLRYEDDEGKEQTPIDSNVVRIIVTTCTWKPPQVVKTADNKHCLRLGDSVRFTIVVSNFTPPWNFATWYNVQVIDDIDPALRIDKVEVTPPADDVTITGNRVVVTFNTLAPGDSYVITIDATLIGPVDSGHIILNKAVVEFQDKLGNPQPPWESEVVRVCTKMRIYLPIIRRIWP
jgi:fimbrial isopeptide formation D2 family protein